MNSVLTLALRAGEDGGIPLGGVLERRNQLVGALDTCGAVLLVPAGECSGGACTSERMVSKCGSVTRMSPLAFKACSWHSHIQNQPCSTAVTAMPILTGPLDTEQQLPWKGLLRKRRWLTTGREILRNHQAVDSENRRCQAITQSKYVDNGLSLQGSSKFRDRHNLVAALSFFSLNELPKTS